MQHGGDYSSFYAAPQYPPPASNPNPNPTEFPPPNPIQPSSYASAPPLSHFPTDFPAYSGAAAPSYSSYPQNPEPVPNLPPPAAPQPSFVQPQSQFPPQTPQFPTFQHYNPSPYSSEPSPSPPTYPHLQQPPPYYQYEPNQPAANYASPVNPISNPYPSPSPSSSFSSPFPSYDISYERKGAQFDQGSGYLADNSGRYGTSVTGGYGPGRSGFDQDFYEKKSESPVAVGYGGVGLQDSLLGDGIYPYDGGRSEPYGARGTAPSRSPTLFDDYGRSLSFPSGGKDQERNVGKIVRAVPKVETQQDVRNGVQKFRVKLLPEGGGQSTMDVLCQIGLDGIRMLDPSTNRNLRIYPLENVTRWEVVDSSIFAFWSKSSVDIDPRRIRLQSNSYTTNTILDTVTAAAVQLKEMGGKDALLRGKGTADTGKQFEQLGEKKKGFDWINLIKPPNEEKDHWVPDEAVTKCTSCRSDFGAFNRRHHCRNCGDIFCDKCTQGRIALTADEDARPVRVCDRCMAEVSHRLSNAKEAANKPAELHSHEDLARKLQEEMDKNRKSSSVSKSSDGSGRRTREVACPICTVHLQVQVPASGSETIECGVCQSPFLVSAH